MVSRIPLPENTETLFMAGEDLEQVWHDLCLWKGDMRADRRTVFYRYGNVCPAQGCNRCTNPDCSCADFIRRYWNHPRSD
jgi:hypothetical protein